MLKRQYNTSRTPVLLSLFLSAALTACSSDSSNNAGTAIPMQLDAYEQVPVTASMATASGNLQFNETTRSLSGSVSSNGMSITVAHIHTGEAGSNGGVILSLEVENNIASVPANTTLTQEQSTALLNGDYYINLHSETYPAGEIRGQITPSGIEVLSISLSGENEIPALSNSGTGTGYVTLRDKTNSVSIAVVSNTDTPATAAHLHTGFDGENGGVIFGMEADASEAGRFTGSASLDADVYSNIKQGGSYINVHTQANPGGELRGQLLPNGISVYHATLSGDQEIPPVSTTATGLGYLTLNSEANTLTAIVRTSELTNATMAHVHAGSRTENGGVIVGLAENTDDSSVWQVRNASISAEDKNRIQSSNTYFNVHTSTNAGGEIRGQIISNSAASQSNTTSASNPIRYSY